MYSPIQLGEKLAHPVAPDVTVCEMATKFCAHFGMGCLIALLFAWLLLKLWPRPETPENVRSALGEIIQTGLLGAFMAAIAYACFALLDWLTHRSASATQFADMITNLLAFFGGGFIVSMLACLPFLKKIRSLENMMPRDLVTTLLAGFWGAVISVAIDLDHFTRFYGNPNGRVWHTLWAEVAAVLLFYHSVRLVIKLINAQFKPCPGKSSIYWNVVGICLCLCVIAHVVEDYTINKF